MGLLCNVQEYSRTCCFMLSHPWFMNRVLRNCIRNILDYQAYLFITGARSKFKGRYLVSLVEC